MCAHTIVSVNNEIGKKKKITKLKLRVSIAKIEAELEANL